MPAGPASPSKWLNPAVPVSRSVPPRRSLHLSAVGIGGAVGTGSRAGLLEWAGPGDGWPWPTFAANLVGTVLLVTLIVRAPKLMDPSGTWRSLLGVGFCGGLTTFSLFQIELVRFLKAGDLLLALGYCAASLLAGLAAAMWVRPAREHG